jgi:hypothetical protein
MRVSYRAIRLICLPLVIVVAFLCLPFVFWNPKDKPRPDLRHKI